MATLALGAVGAFAGSFFGPVGASIGWSIGAAIGGVLFPQTQHGPKLSDLHLDVSAYGAAIPIVYGTVRISGNVIWKTKLVPHEHESGGKGGPTSVTTSYTASWAVQLCQTSYIDGAGNLVNAPIEGIRRIWADGRLVYDSTAPNSAFPFTLYTGTEDQMPDPTIEAAEGAGNVNANRGTAYVVFTDMPMDQFYDRIPNLEFEVVCSPVTGTPSLEYYSKFGADFLYEDTTADVGGFYLSHPETLTATRDGKNVQIRSYRCGTTFAYIDPTEYQYETRTFTLKGTQTDTGSAGNTLTTHTVGWAVSVAANCGVSYMQGYVVVNCADCIPNAGIETLTAYAWLNNGVITFTPPVCAVCGTVAAGLHLAIRGPMVRVGDHLYAAMGDGGASAWDNFVGCFALNPATGDVWDINGPNYQKSIDLLSYTNDSGEAVKLCAADDGFLYIYASSSTGATQGGHLLKVDVSADLPVIVRTWSPAEWAPPATTTSLGMFGNFSVIGDYLVTCTATPIGSTGAGTYFYVAYRLEDDNSVTLADWVNVGELVSGDDTLSHEVPGSVISVGGGYMAVRDGILVFQGPGDNGVLWRDIVSDLSRRCGMADDEFDTSAVPYRVRGYALGSQMQGRAAIEPLMQGFLVDAVDSDTAVKFIPRGGESVATIPDADLGARPLGSEPVPLFQYTRQQEIELPEILNVVYRNRDADYLQNTQIAQRHVTESKLSSTINLPIVFTDEEGKSLADAMLYSAWVERDRIRVTLPRKWAHLEPTDIVTFSAGTYRITQKQESQSGVITFDAVLHSPGAFQQAAVPAEPGGQEPGTPPTVQATSLLPLDIPLVTDSDYANGYPTLMRPFASFPWAGAELFKSVDGGSNFTSLLQSNRSDDFGTATTVLGDWDGGNVIDEINSVTVQLGMPGGTLESVTHDALLSGANMALVGFEIMQYRDAELVSSGVYTLTGLLRGRRGTEYAQGAHLAGERFAVLPAVNAVDGPWSELGQQVILNATTSGNTLSSLGNAPFINTGMALRPYAPILLGGGPDGSGDVTLTWTRRTRVGGGWLDFVDAPISEPIEQYVLEVWDATYQLCARSGIVQGETTAVYTAAMQVTDFGANQANVYFTIAQIGTNRMGQRTRGVAPGLGSTDDEPLVPIPYYAYPSSVRPPPAASGCAVNATFTPGDIVTLDSFVIGQRYVGQFTTGSGTFGGRVLFAGSTDQHLLRTVWIATDSCGVGVVANSVAMGRDAAIDFGSTGLADCVLLPTTVYYFIAEFHESVAPVGAAAPSTITLY